MQKIVPAHSDGEVHLVLLDVLSTRVKAPGVEASVRKADALRVGLELL